MNPIDIMLNKRRQSKGVHTKQSHLYDARTGKLIMIEVRIVVTLGGRIDWEWAQEKLV